MEFWRTDTVSVPTCGRSARVGVLYKGNLSIIIGTNITLLGNLVRIIFMFIT